MVSTSIWLFWFYLVCGISVWVLARKGQNQRCCVQWWLILHCENLPRTNSSDWGLTLANEVPNKVCTNVERERSFIFAYIQHGRLETERRFVGGIWATTRKDLFLTQFDRVLRWSKSFEASFRVVEAIVEQHFHFLSNGSLKERSLQQHIVRYNLRCFIFSRPSILR